jgi:serine/threonine protein kinase
MDVMVGWLGQLVEALDYAHQQGILHRDIKPANLMLTSEPQRLKVMDFGIARVVSGTHTTQHTAMMGSMYYAAPELLRGQAATPSADIYSFGVLVYEMLTGEPRGTVCVAVGGGGGLIEGRGSMR